VRAVFYFTAATALLLLALAEPVYSRRSERGSEALNCVFVVDISRSMDAEDYPSETSRIWMARQCIFHLLEAYPEGMAGLVLFTDKPLSFGLTSDREVTRFLLQYAAVPSRTPRGGTDLAAGIEAALELVKKSPYSKEIRTIVLLTDGGDATPASFRNVCSQLEGVGIRVVAVGLGGDTGVPIPVRDTETGNITAYYLVDGRQAETSLNEVPLLALAKATDGDYVRVWGKEERLVEAVRRGGTLRRRFLTRRTSLL